MTVAASRPAMWKLRYVWRYFRRRGLITTLRTIRGRILHGTAQAVIYRTTLAGQPAPEQVGEITFSLARPVHLDQLAELERKRYGPDTRRRSDVNEANGWLFVACHGDHVVATRRYSRSFLPGEIWSRVLSLQPSQVWSADAYCSPEYRNQGLNRHFGRYTMRYLASEGFTEEFGVITAANTASLRSVLGRGSELVYFVSYTRILFYTRLVVSPKLPENIAAALVKGPSGTTAGR
jgi:hypothetical protein